MKLMAKALRKPEEKATEAAQRSASRAALSAPRGKVQKRVIVDSKTISQVRLQPVSQARTAHLLL